MTLNEVIIVEDMRTRISRRLRELRKAAELSQDELARAAGGMSLSYLGALERGEQSAGVESLERLARALGVEVVEFLRADTGKRRKNPKRSPEERLGQLVTTLARGAEKESLEKFERFARLWFG
jgi:transcriptional regulator with XRE-family HTH domain